MALPKSRQLFFLIFLISVGLMSTAMLLEAVMELEPCPLCITQRIVVVALGLVGLLGALHNTQTRGCRGYGSAILLLGLTGTGLAIRQLYLQSLPADSVPTCLPGLDYLVDVLPISELVAVMFTGTGNCADVPWQLLGLSIPGWTLLCFVSYSVLGLLEMVRKHNPSS